jgi:hypothetical protein
MNRWTVVLLAGVLAGCSPPASAPAPAPATVTDTPILVATATHTVVPTAIRIPSIGVHATSMIAVGLVTARDATPTQPAGSIATPSLAHPQQIAWYRGSPTPGDVGPAVVLSHRDGDYQYGGFARLDDVQVGDEVDIDRSDHRTAIFRVTDTALYPKTDMTNADVYSNLDHPGLRLITCSGPFDKIAHEYRGQRVVYADLVAWEKTP